MAEVGARQGRDRIASLPASVLIRNREGFRAAHCVLEWKGGCAQREELPAQGQNLDTALYYGTIEQAKNKSHMAFPFSSTSSKFTTVFSLKRRRIGELGTVRGTSRRLPICPTFPIRYLTSSKFLALYFHTNLTCKQERAVPDCNSNFRDFQLFICQSRLRVPESQ